MPPITNPIVEAYDFRATHQLVSTIATGTAPLAITSTTVVPNLNADLLDGQHGSFYQDAANLTGTVASARLSGSYTAISALTASGLITASGGLLVNGGSFASGRIYKDASYGTVVVSQTGAGNDYALLSPAGNLVMFVPTGTFNVSFASLIDVASTIKVGGVQVLTARRTGWTAATGTATRTTFATSTVTLSVLAEHVKALIDDLITHGAIGA